jgi:hypothetical protein
MTMYELGIYGDIANVCGGFMAIWMVHRLYHSNRRPWQTVVVWTSLVLLWMLGAPLLRALLPGLSYERASELLGLTGLCAYVYLFTHIPLCQRVFTFFLSETAMALIALAARVMSVSLVQGVAMEEWALFLIIFFALLVGFGLLFACRLQSVILDGLMGFGKNLWVLTLFAAAGYGMLLVLADPWAPWDSLTGMEILEWIGIILFVVVAYAVAFKAMLAVCDQEAAENDANRLEEQIALSEEYYKSLVEQVELARSYNHDMHYHMETLNGLSAAGDLDGMQQYVADMGKDLPGSLPTQYCEVGAVNALLERYADICRREDIQLRCQLHIPANTKVHPIHLCVIFGNALQNALEAVEKLAPGMERWIQVRANQEQDRLAIQVTNLCPDRPEINNGHVKTTKRESGHGMGLENVRTAAQRYHGWSGASWDNGIFSLNIELHDV